MKIEVVTTSSVREGAPAVSHLLGGEVPPFPRYRGAQAHSLLPDLPGRCLCARGSDSEFRGPAFFEHLIVLDTGFAGRTFCDGFSTYYESVKSVILLFGSRSAYRRAGVKAQCMRSGPGHRPPRTLFVSGCSCHNGRRPFPPARGRSSCGSGRSRRPVRSPS